MSDDTRDIIDLTVAYARAIDERNWAALDDVFVDEATASMPDPLSSRREIVERISRTLTPLDASQHFVSNHLVSIVGDEATCRCYLLAQHVRKIDGRRRTFIVGGGYDDRLVRTSGGWRISHRRLNVTWTDGDPTVIEHPR